MRAVSTAASAMRHAFGVGLEAILVVAIAATLIFGLAPMLKPADILAGTGTAAAARPTAHKANNVAATATITVADGVFAGTTTATVTGGVGMWAYAACYQDGIVVLRQFRDATSGTPVTFILGPTTKWTGGPAECIGQEGDWAADGSWRVLAETTFHVAG